VNVVFAGLVPRQRRDPESRDEVVESNLSSDLQRRIIFLTWLLGEMWQASSSPQDPDKSHRSLTNAILLQQS
jgi:hypothetical protein